MDKFIIEGGHRLQGSLTVSGSKNSALPILAATLLTRERCVIHRVPNLSDTRHMLELLRYLGAEVYYEQGTVIVRAETIHAQAPYDLVRKMRASICILGPLLARCGYAQVSLPGGCVIGDRPIDIHLHGLRALGATITTESGNIHASATRLVGQEIFMGGKFGSTVLGTDNVMMAATRADGTTIIENAACEPEVVDLAQVLCKMGASIQGAGTRRIEIQGARELHGFEHTIIPDRIEAGTFMVAAAITRSAIQIRGVCRSHMQAILSQLEACGVRFSAEGQTLSLSVPEKLNALEIATDTYPGFPTDMQAQFCALLSITSGISVVTDKIFPNRFMHISELKRMGAQADLQGNTVIIKGVPYLSGAPVMASDLRASAALVLAGLAAKGNTEVLRVYHIDRGYERIDEKLRAVGAVIKRVPQ
ncbi:MAG: UDP-N-acetylglucosamine 1-carboxyvinyltransferase [Methylacidiphilales bacterium]|nr:UDP-N-acetylglucosamine 1-carboxyvinyltransferase [Candidatus Methylacidiphilales bacterium]MDW8349714.1 UDP-N-acetylglucosamine 1-carboxyvinyltransferase [Verrucomicrobiae bacterium]